MKRRWRVIEAVCTICVMLICLVSCDNTPLTPAVILPGEKADAYREEFVRSLVSSWDEREKAQPYYYFDPAFRMDSRMRRHLSSPNGAYQVMQTPLRDYHHGITLSKSGSQESETILFLQEGSPGSGCSHSLQWAGDSKAVFIYGGGKPVGHPRSWDLALVYLVDSKTLHAVDIKPLLKERTEADRQNRAASRSKPPA